MSTCCSRRRTTWAPQHLHGRRRCSCGVRVRGRTCTGITGEQLVMAVDGTLRFRQRPRQRWMRCDAVLVRADAWHEVDARGTNVLIAFVDAESELGAALAERTTTDVAPIPVATVGEWRRQLGDSASLTAARVEPWVTGTLLRDLLPPSIDHRVKRVLRDLPEAGGGSRGRITGCARRERRSVCITISAPLHDICRRSPAPVCPLAAPATWRR